MAKISKKYFGLTLQQRAAFKEAGCTVIDLTDIDQLRLDPTGRARAFISSWWDAGEPVCQNVVLDTRLFNHAGDYTKFWDSWWKKLDSLKHSSPGYMAYNLSCKKYVGPQGLRFGSQYVIDYYLASYRNAKDRPSLKLVLLGRDFLMRKVRQLIDKYGYPQPCYAKRLTTAGGLPVAGHKSEFFTETIGVGNHLPTGVNLPGQRYMRLKPRTINQDATQNVRQLEDHLLSVRNWLKRYLPEYFGAWLDARQWIEPVISAHINDSYCVETDYEAMDQHYTPTIARETVYPIYELLLPYEKQHFLMYVDSLWSQPTYLGSVLLTGEHTLLSGESITNDFETVTQVCQAIGATIASGLDPNDMVTFHLGDDQLAMFRRLRDAEAYRDNFVCEANDNLMLMQLQKCQLRKSCGMFCRRTYEIGGCRVYNPYSESFTLIGAYPSTLTLNSIITPERGADSAGELACATYQRLDNLYGSPEYAMACQHVAKFTRLTDLRITQADIDAYSTKDWWYRLYGEAWSPLSSRSFRFLHRI